jgi:hypothetical protein
MEHMAAPIAKLSHTSATMSIVCLAVSSIIRSAKRRASSARRRQNPRSLMSMERAGGRHGRRVLGRARPQRAASSGECSPDLERICQYRPDLVLLQPAQRRARLRESQCSAVLLQSLQLVAYFFDYKVPQFLSAVVGHKYNALCCIWPVTTIAYRQPFTLRLPKLRFFFGRTSHQRLGIGFCHGRIVTCQSFVSADQPF